MLLADVASAAPDVCLLDIGFPDDDGIAATGRILPAAPTTAVVMHSAHSDESLIEAALAAGARGFLSKAVDLAVIVASLGCVMNGEVVVVPSGATRRLIPEQRRRNSGERPMLDYLTGRELDVLRRLMRGDSTDRIADALGTARSTTRSHIQNILAKLGARNRREAVAFATRQGMRPLPAFSERAMALAGAAEPWALSR
jgi:DNA-binding NarL/FixJ family response regulator